MDLSIVIPIFNEEESVGPLLDELRRVLDPTGRTYEVVCVDDGSTDGSLRALRAIARGMPELVVCEFRRNFGQTAAMQAGFDAARGDVIITMDADLQNDPNDIPAMLAKIDEGYDLVAGWRAGRKDRFLDRRLPSMIANWLISRATKVRLHDYGCTIKAMRSDLAKELKLYGEMHRFIPAIASLVGARIHELKVGHRARRFGASKYGIGRTVRVVLDLLTVLFLKTYLARPMQVFGLWGLGFLAAGFATCGALSIEKLVYGHPLADRPLLLFGAMLILVGFQLLSLGLIADLLSRTYHEAQDKKPYYVRNWIVGGEARPASVAARPQASIAPEADDPEPSAPTGRAKSRAAAV